ncbi:restriction endonuclease [Archangium gephyra]|uniref:restriction endonuclease n=1 Tax=Archangium gephyra TaxID=48 RepID=UPI003B79491D
MAKSEEYIRKIKRIKKPADITRMYRQLQSGTSLRDWPEGKAFEYLVLRAFELEGAEVTWPFSVRRDGKELEQIDGAVQDGGLYCLLEMKQYKDSIDFDAIAKLRARLARRPTQAMGAIFSIRGFTDPAKVLAQFSTPINVLLWDADDIEYGLTSAQCVLDYKRSFVTPSSTDFRTTVFWRRRRHDSVRGYGRSVRQ